MERIYIEETTVYEVSVDSLKEAKEVIKKFYADGYEQGMPLKIRHTETSVTNGDGEEIDIDEEITL